MNGKKIASEYGKAVANYSTIYALLPCVGSGSYLLPDFRDVIEEYLTLLPYPKRRLIFVKRREEITQATKGVLYCHYHSLCHGRLLTK